MPLAESIERGLRERAIDAAKEMLQTVPPLEVVNNELIPALDRVGKGFEKGTVFLPQLLSGKETAPGRKLAADNTAFKISINTIKASFTFLHSNQVLFIFIILYAQK